MCSLGAHSVMIATAAESNPSCFSPTPLVDLEKTLVPPYLRLVGEVILQLKKALNSICSLNIWTITGA